MDKKSLIKLLKALKHIKWHDRVIDGSNENIKWLPVVSYECSAGVTHKSGLGSDGIWRGEYSDSRRVTKTGYSPCFFTILEFERVSFLELLRNSILSAGLPENIIRTFPFDDIMLAAMRAHGHWASLADSWLEQGFPLSPQMIIEFTDHKLVRKWEKQHLNEIINAK